MSRLRALTARVLRLLRLGLLSKLLTLRDVLSIVLHTVMAVVICMGGFWADFAVGCYLVGIPFARMLRRASLV